MRDFVNTIDFPAAANILLLYPGESLRNQIGLWASRCFDRRVDVSFERSLPEIRSLLPYADMVVVDATEDPSQATDAFAGGWRLEPAPSPCTRS